jgi:acyl carrier protein
MYAMRERAEVATALIHRLAAHLELDVDDRKVDRDTSFLDSPELMMDGLPLDSFDLVDALTALEEELSVRLGDGELHELDTINRLADAIGATVSADDVDWFCARWL